MEKKIGDGEKKNLNSKLTLKRAELEGLKYVRTTCLRQIDQVIFNAIIMRVSAHTKILHS